MVRLDASFNSASLPDENMNGESCPSPATAAAERWNESRTNVFRILASFFCFIVMGANDSAYGVSRRSTFQYVLC